MAADNFLKIEGIPGESTDDKHTEWIEILSFNHGVTQSAGGDRSTGGAATSGRCDHQDFSIVKSIDKTSPSLNEKCCDGTHISELKVELCRSTGKKEKYMEYTFGDVIVSSISIGGGGGGLPTESVTFNYGKITWNYIPMDHKTGAAQGHVENYWDCTANTGG
jgi:type VI secretion system secreted protein Hcp